MWSVFQVGGVHQMGELIKAETSGHSKRIGVDTFSGKVHVEWDP